LKVIVKLSESRPRLLAKVTLPIFGLLLFADFDAISPATAPKSFPSCHDIGAITASLSNRCSIHSLLTIPN